MVVERLQKDESQLREEFVDIKTKYFFYKYIYSRYLESKYNYIFGKYEIEKMKNIYDSFIFDKTIENRFFLNLKGANISTDLEKLIAKAEYEDLENQINLLKLNRLNSTDKIEEIKFVLENNILDIISRYIDGYDPYLNNISESKDWKKFKSYLINDKLKSILVLENKFDNRNSEYVPDDIEIVIDHINENIESLNQYFPFNQEDIFNSDDNINKKIEDIKLEINKSKKTLKSITNVYLYTNENKGLES